MKTLWIAIWTLAALIPATAEAAEEQFHQIRMIRIEVEYRGLSPEWIENLRAVGESSFEDLNAKVVKLPTVTVRSGRDPSTLEVIREARLGPEGKSSVKHGVIFKIAGVVADEGVRLFGTATLRRPLDEAAHVKRGEFSIPTQFVALELLIDVKLQDQESAIFELEDGGTLVITPTLIDAAGRPIKN